MFTTLLTQFLYLSPHLNKETFISYLYHGNNLMLMYNVFLYLGKFSLSIRFNWSGVPKISTETPTPNCYQLARQVAFGQWPIQPEGRDTVAPMKATIIYICLFPFPYFLILTTMFHKLMGVSPCPPILIVTVTEAVNKALSCRSKGLQLIRKNSR